MAECVYISNLIQIAANSMFNKKLLEYYLQELIVLINNAKIYIAKIQQSIQSVVVLSMMQLFLGIVLPGSIKFLFRDQVLFENVGFTFFSVSNHAQHRISHSSTQVKKSIHITRAVVNFSCLV